MNLKVTKDNVLVSIDMENKTKCKFSNGIEIEIVKGFEYNLRYENPSIGEVIDAEYIPKGAMVLVHHNSIQPSYKVFNADEDNIFSLPIDLVFLYNTGNGWMPNKDFLITYRIFKKYKGLLLGIEPELIPNRLYVVKGEIDGKWLDGKVCVVTKNSDYRIVYHIDGKPTSIIRTRSREILAEDVEATNKVKGGEYLIGFNSSDAKPLN